MKKRFLSIVLTLAMMLTLMPGMTMTVNAATLTADEVMTKIDASANLLEGNIDEENCTLFELFSEYEWGISDYIAYMEDLLREEAEFNSSEAPRYKWTISAGDLLIVELNGNGVVIYAYLADVGEFTYTPPTHEHDWQYSETGNKLEAYCANAGCDNYATSYDEAKTNNKLVTLTLTASSANYSGIETYAASLGNTSAWTGAGLSVPTIKYYKANSAGSTEGTEEVIELAGLAVGNYYAAVTMGTATAKAAFSITPTVDEVAGMLDGHTVTSDLKNVTKVTIDGKVVDSRYYTVSGGNIILSGEFMKTLTNGKHTVKLYDGAKVATGIMTVSGNVAVISAATGDMGVALYAALSVSSILGMGWVGRKKRDEE